MTSLAILSLPAAFIDSIGSPELLTILFIALLLFGGDKLPELARGLGRSLREFRKATGTVQDEIKRAIEEDDAPPPRILRPPPPTPPPPAAPASPPTSPPREPPPPTAGRT